MRKAVLAYEAGIPEDLFVIVNGSAAEISDVFAQNPIIRKISFTGSTEVGIKIFRNGTDQIKKLSLELGGNARFIVFDDADLDKAVEGALASKFATAAKPVCAATACMCRRACMKRFARAWPKSGRVQTGQRPGRRCEPRAAD